MGWSSCSIRFASCQHVAEARIDGTEARVSVHASPRGVKHRLPGPRSSLRRRLAPAGRVGDRRRRQVVEIRRRHGHAEHVAGDGAARLTAEIDIVRKIKTSERR